MTLALWAATGSTADRRRSLGLLTGLVGVVLVVAGDIGTAGGVASSRRSG